jgi:hypothetical protein
VIKGACKLETRVAAADMCEPGFLPKRVSPDNPRPIRRRRSLRTARDRPDHEAAAPPRSRRAARCGILSR